MEAERIFVPPDFYCPISGELMVDPVSDPEGNSYEKSQITDWLKINKTSPITRSYLDMSLLKSNIPLRKSIESIRDKLQEDQLRIDSQISQLEMKPYIESLDSIELNTYYLENKLFVNIDMPDIDIRPPIDIVLCIDVSYSMYDEATLKGEQNENISHGFSILSLTVTAAKTILQSLNEHDNISIVTYSSEALTVVNNQPCTPENKVLIEGELDSLKPISNTNMWAGMIQSLDILRTSSIPDKLKGIILLTDGIPNVDPPRGHEYMLRKYFSDHNFKCMISCYGFGYNLNSELLLNISRISGGDGYSFIPDASILGSTFINGISNLLTTAVYNPILNIELTKDVLLDKQRSSIEICIDSLKYGQSKNLVFDVDTSRSTSQSLSYLNNFAKVSLSFNGKTLETRENLRPMGDYFREQRYRHDAVSLINHCIDLKKYNDNSFRDKLNYFVEQLKSDSDNEFIENLLYDFNGQIREALNMTSEGEREDWFSRWGIHYLRSLQEAYNHEICNNFKDKAISNFGGTLFNTLRDAISSIFDALPPPKRDIRHTPTYGRGAMHRGGSAMQSCAQSSRMSPPRTMEIYNSQSGGCCAEGCRILMEDGVLKNVEDVQKNDVVVTYHFNNGEIYHTVGRIECVVKTKCKMNFENMVTLGSLVITPYHPIINFIENEYDWSFPVSREKPRRVYCNYMYTFVLDNRCPVVIEGRIFATYGNDLQGNVIQHDYFGKENVIEDLKKFDTYQDGYVELTKDMFQRNNNTNNVFKIEK